MQLKKNVLQGEVRGDRGWEPEGSVQAAALEPSTTPLQGKQVGNQVFKINGKEEQTIFRLFFL